MIWQPPPPGFHRSVRSLRGAVALAALLVLAGLGGPSAVAASRDATAGTLVVAAAETTARLPRPRPGEANAEAQPAETPAADAAEEENPPPEEAAETEGDVETAPEAEAAEVAPPDDDDVEEAVAEEPAADDGTTVPLPRPRPMLTDADVARLLALDFYGFTPDFTLKAALDAVEAGRYDEARERAREHANPLVSKLVEWLVARQPDSGMSAGEIIAVLQSHAGWPEPEKLQLRAEEAFHALGPEGEPVLTFYSQAEPLTVGGRLSLASAYRQAGRAEEAKAIVRDLWRQWRLSSSQAGSILTRFGSLLSRDDHLFRYRRLVLDRRTSEAIAQAQLIGPGYDDLARATIAVLGRSSDAASLLRGVAPRFFADPLYIFGRVRLLRRGGQPIEAARLLLLTRPDRELEGNGDVWWDERRDLSRELLDAGLPDLAYRVVADARPGGEGERVEAAFHAGWYALRFLGEPPTAEPYFRELHALATLPRTQSRASYWLGRTHEAWGRPAAARLDYVEAARFGGTFYGQLARQKLGLYTTGLERTPRPSALDRIRFTGREMVQTIRLLAAAGHAELASPFFPTLGETVDTPGEVALTLNLSRRIELTHAGIRAAAIAEERGVKVASLPAPFVGVPAELEPPETVDRALVYAVVRQESAFNFQAVSHVGAQGLMQLMPATARATARNIRLPFSLPRLTSDPLYNATIGSHHLGELLEGLRSSYILTFVGYNAGPGRALQWIRSYGDPRDGSADPVDWIERIPFDETRDYVQKVMENLQLYRSRVGHPLSLNEDLIRGGS